jgi:hypothetical protein
VGGCTAAIALAFLVATSGAATYTHQYGYGVVAIRNPNRGTLNYKLKWGAGGDWSSYSVGPGSYFYHYYPLDEDGRAPAPIIEFDYVLNDGAYTPREYRLGFYSAASPSYSGAKKYVFRESGGYLDLYNSY